MIPARLDFECRNNADYVEELPFQDDGVGVDLMHHTFTIVVKTSVTTDTVLKTFSTVATELLEGIFLIEPRDGFIQVRFEKESLDTMFSTVEPSLLVGDVIALPYDMQVTLPTGDVEVWLFGFFNLHKGITNG
jgi:hypothetical protein